jgi:hypothetical protein
MKIPAPDLRRKLDHRDGFRQLFDEELWSRLPVGAPPRVDLTLGLGRDNYDRLISS